MADSDKDIDIGISVTGADQAAAEVSKLEHAIRNMNREASPSPEHEAVVQAAKTASANAGDDAAKAARRLEFELRRARRQAEEMADAATAGFGGMLEQVEKTTAAVEKEAGALSKAAEERSLLTAEEIAAAEAAGTAAKEFSARAEEELKARKTAEAIRQTAAATRMQLALEAAEELKKYVAGLSEGIEKSGAFGAATGTVVRAMGAAKAGLDVLTVGLSTYISTGNAAVAMTAAVATGGASFFDAMAQTDAALANRQLSIERMKDSMDELVAFYARYKSLAGDRAAIETMDEELRILREQEQSIVRANEARQRLASAQNEAAALEVRMARATGGDEAAAAATQLATQLATGLQKLEGDLAAAKTRMEIANRSYDQLDAEVGLMESMKDTQSEEYQRLVAARDRALEDRAKAAEALDDQTEAFRLSRQNLIRGVETSLAETENQYASATSEAAKKGFDAVYQQLVTAQAGQADAVAGISADMGAVTAALTAKAAEVAEAQRTHAEETVRSIAALAPQPAQTEAITGAVRELGTGIESMGASTISALQQTANIVGEQDRKIRALGEKLQVLAARIR